MENELVHLDTEYILVIDTDTYSYPFFKKLCAYCTGHTDENQEAQDCADLFFSDLEIKDDDAGEVAERKNPFYGLVNFKNDESNLKNILSPCSIWFNKNYGCNSRGEQFRLTETNWDELNFPAILSVGIYFFREPDSELIELLKKRSFDFFEKVWPYLTNEPRYKKVTIEGYRFITHFRYGKEKSI